MTQYSTYELGERIANAAAAGGINPRIAVEQLRQESGNFNPRYVYGPGRSPAGAEGLAQFIPGTWQRYGSGSPFDPDNAIRAYVRYMRDLLAIFNGRYDLALAGYNWGEHRQTLRSARDSGRSVLEYSIPNETRNYVRVILNAAGYSIADVVAGTTTTPPPPASSPRQEEPTTGGGGLFDADGGNDFSFFGEVTADNDESEQAGAALVILTLVVALML